jgi:hypothetical protein
MLADVIDRVNTLAWHNKVSNGLEFRDQNRISLETEDEIECNSDDDFTFYPGGDESSTQSKHEVFNNFDYEYDNNTIPGRNNPWRKEKEEEKQE